MREVRKRFFAATLVCLQYDLFGVYPSLVQWAIPHANKRKGGRLVIHFDI